MEAEHPSVRDEYRFTQNYASIAAMHLLEAAFRSDGEPLDHTFTRYLADWKNPEDRKRAARQERRRFRMWKGEPWNWKLLSLRSDGILFDDRHGRTREMRSFPDGSYFPKYIDHDYLQKENPGYTFDTPEKSSNWCSSNPGQDLLALLDSVLPDFYSYPSEKGPATSQGLPFYSLANRRSHAATGETFIHYIPLPDSDWFRLLILEPAEFIEPIACRLVTLQRSTATSKYETLSYSWRGGQWHVPDDVILCNGEPMHVTANLHKALKHIRRVDRPRTMWIDAVCISQADKDERSQQVRIMASIYAQSARTLIWLGPVDATIVKCAFEQVRRLVNSWRGNHEATREIDTETPSGTGVSAHTETLLQDETESWNALRILYDCDWFTRKWVIQEVVTSKSLVVIWGTSSISWGWIGTAAAILRTQHQQTVRRMNMHGVYNAYLMFRLRQEGHLAPLRPSFLQLLRLTSHFNATVPLDNAYALLGIRTTDNSEEQPFLSVDYSIEGTEMSRRVVEKLLQGPRPLSFLSQVPFRGIDRKETESIISWLPDCDFKGPPLLRLWDLEDQFQPGRGLPFRRYTGYSIPDSMLAVDGIVFSTVIWVGELTSDWKMNAREVLRILGSGAFGELTTETLAIFSRTLRAGGNAYGSREEQSHTFTEDFANLLIQNAGDQEEQPFLAAARDLAPQGNADRFIEAANRVCRDRCIFVTVSGHLGLGSFNTAVGDVVAILGGADMPVLLSRSWIEDDGSVEDESEGDEAAEDGSEQNESEQNRPEQDGSEDDEADEDGSEEDVQRIPVYEFHGECFIHNAMEGEVVEAAKAETTHRGPFDPTLLLETLHRFDALTEESQAEFAEMKAEILEKARKAYERLEVEMIRMQ